MATKKTVKANSAQQSRKPMSKGQRKVGTTKPKAKAPTATVEPESPATETPKPGATQQAATEERTCYLCKKPIRNGDAQPIGKGLFRHPDCDPAEAETKKADAAKGRKSKAGRGKVSLLEAAIQIMRKASQPMSAKDVTEKVLSKGLWTTKGATPHATLYASILREIQKKGAESRFVKTGKGKFALKN